MNLSKPGLFNKRFIKTTLIFTFMISTALVVFSRYIYAAPPFLSAQNPPIQNANDQRCADEAAGNDGVIGWSVPLSAVQIVGSNWGEVTYRTYVCNGSNTALTRDVTMTRGRGTIVAAPPAGNGAIGSTDVLDYSQTGWSFSSPWYSQEMGSYSPHSWRYQDVTFRVDGSKFPVSGNYTVQVTGKGVVYTAISQGETGEVSMNIYLTIIKTNPSSCSVTSSPAGNIAPGQNVVLTFQVTNGGNLPGAVDWDTTQYRLGLKPDSAIMSQKTVGLTPDAGNMLRMNRTSTSTLSFTAPSTVGSYALRWELQKIDGTWHDDILDNCGITLNVGNSPAAFSCSSGFYQIADGSLYSIIPTTAQRAFIANTGLTINAIGYNTLDNYMYGIVRSGANNGNLVRIGVDGSINLLGVVPWSPNVIAGDMDSSGNLWYIPSAGGSTIVRVNVASRAQTSYTLSDSDASETSDLVYIGGALYGIHSISGRVIRIPTSGFIGQTIPTTLYGSSPLSGLINAGSAPYQMTSSWTSSADRMYVFQSDSNAIYEILDYNTPNPYAVVRAPSSPGSYSNTDGASCANAPDPYTANTNYPFLRVNGSDVISGSKFGSLASRCETYPTTGLIGDIKTNGFKNHNYSATVLDDILSGSSSAQYAAYSKGRIFSAGSGQSFITNNGLYRSLSSSSTKYARDIMFSNDMNTGSNYGNYYDDSGLPCVDIAKVEQEATLKSAPGQLNSIITDMTTPKEVVKMNGAGNWLVSSPITIPTGRQITIITEGKVTINSNITYAKTGVANNGSVVAPMLMIIAKGGIEIGQNVTRLDGYYLAHGSTLSTCGDLAVSQTSVCDKQLVVGGALVGKKIEWRRNYGTLKGRNTTLANPGNVHCAVVDTAAGNVGAVPGALNSCAAERVDFSPAFYFANPFTTGSASSSIHGQPLNTTELPPIY